MSNKAPTPQRTPSPQRTMLPIALGLVAIGVAALARPSAGVASDPCPSANKVIVHTIKRDGQGDAVGSFDDKSVAVAFASGCDGKDMRNIDTETVTKGQDGKTAKTRIILCNRDGKDTADTVSSLEKARAKIADDKNIPDNARKMALAAIDREIASLKTPKGFSRQ